MADGMAESQSKMTPDGEQAATLKAVPEGLVRLNEDIHRLTCQYFAAIVELARPPKERLNDAEAAS